MPPGSLKNPLEFMRWNWPDVYLYDRQCEAILSVFANDETEIVAANKVGKDFLAGITIPTFFLMRWPCRIVTTSVKDDHLRVLWGEIGRFVQTSAHPLLFGEGGPLIVNHREIRRVHQGKVCKISYVLGTVSERGEGLAGHHAEHTLLVCDEATGVDDVTYTQGRTWANKVLAFGNPNNVPKTHWFRKAVEGGDVPSDEPGRFYRKVFRITARDSPNVALGLLQEQAGLPPTNDILVPGILTFAEYKKRMATWDEIAKTVGLSAEFYEGAEIQLFPAAWLDRAHAIADRLRGTKRQAKSIGVDPGEGMSSTSMYAVDEYGIVDRVSKKTPDTNVITGEAIAFGRKHNVPPECWVFDRGGGGQQIADRLRAQGYDVRTVSFGEAVVPEPRRGSAGVAERIEQREERTVYKNRRAQMYGELREALDPSNGRGFAIPAEYTELRRQMAPIPLTYDDEGKLVLLSKNKKTPGSNQQTLVELIGCSPDESDALVLSTYGMWHPTRRSVAGAF